MLFRSDIILKFVLNHNFEILYNIKKHIGEGVFGEGDQYDINTIKSFGGFGKLVDEAELEVLKAYEKFRLKNKQSIYTIFHSSILFESGWNKNMDYTITVFAPERERIDRCRQECDTDLIDIHTLMNAEMSDLEKNGLADFVVHNYDDHDVLKQVNRIDQRIIDKYLSSEHTAY